MSSKLILTAKFVAGFSIVFGVLGTAYAAFKTGDEDGHTWNHAINLTVCILLIISGVVLGIGIWKENILMVTSWIVLTVIQVVLCVAWCIYLIVHLVQIKNSVSAAGDLLDEESRDRIDLTSKLTMMTIGGYVIDIILSAIYMVYVLRYRRFLAEKSTNQSGFSDKRGFTAVTQDA